jgi:flagellar hook-associated protein 2
MIRIGGLASGMDIDKLVTDLMRAERMKADKLYRSKQVLQWQREDFRSINSLLLGFRNTVFDMRLQSTLMKNSITVSDGSAVDAAVGAAAREGSYTLRVENLAAQASTQSGGSISKALESDYISDTISVGAENNEFRINLDGVERNITIEEGDYTVEALAAELQSQADASFGPGQITVGSITDGTGMNRLTFQPAGEYKPQITLKSGENDALGILGFNDGASFRVNINASVKDMAEKFKYSPFDGESGEIEFSINGQVFYYDFDGEDSEKTMSGIISDINKNSNAGVQAYYDSITDKIIIKSKDYGAGARVSIENTKGSLFGSGGALQIEENVSYGENSQIVLNDVVITKSSNKFTIDGISYDLKSTTSDTITMNVQKDTQGAVDAVKNFVEEYNKIIDAINDKLYEERLRDYVPLTDEQKDAMSDREVELWEEKARSGLLRNDPVLNSIVSGMRELMYQDVKETGSAYNTLSAIGIGTKNYKDMGRLTIDEGKLIEALNNDMEGVMSLFNSSGEAEGEKGIAVRLYDSVNSSITRLSEKAGSAANFTTYDNSYLGERIRDMDKRIESMEAYLLKVEDRHWRQFTAMEKALDQMNTQSMWLSQQLAFWGN